MIYDEDRQALIEYRLIQAEQTILEVEKLIEIDLLNVAVNRIYYGMFYCLCALAIQKEYQSSKHLQLIGWFNQTFIKTELIDVKYGRILRDAYKNRSDGDYAPFIVFGKEDVVAMADGLKDFVEAMSIFIRNRYQV
jgi:uncharacterized protein (UPF0332 family)